MKVFGHENPGVTVVANAAQLQLLITLLENKQLVEPERAIRLCGAPLFAAFHNFSNGHIQEAIDEAVKAGKADVTLVGYGGTLEQFQAAQPAPTPGPDKIPTPITRDTN